MITLQPVTIHLEGIEVGKVYSNPNDPTESACPVCGSLIRSDQPPVANAEKGLAFSWDICPCCHTQFGLDDEFECEPGGLEKSWSVLREAWLSRIILTPEIRSQLRNIEVEVGE